jgi:hypothetical protein
MLIVVLVTCAGAFGTDAGASVAEQVPISGALGADSSTPQPGDTIRVYFNVTALEDLDVLSLTVEPDAGLVALEGETTHETLHDVRSGQTHTLVVRMRVSTAGEHTIKASASLEDTPELARKRAFVLVLNPTPKPTPPTRSGTDADGQPLIIFPNGATEKH